MKKYLILHAFLFIIYTSIAQEVLHLQNGATVTVQNGVELNLQGGIGFDNGSSLANNGTLRLKNNAVANISDWLDNSSAGALNGAGMVIFNSPNNQNFSGATNFYTVQINDGGLSLNNNFTVSNLLNLITGKIITSSNYVFLNNNAAVALLNDISNTAYTNSWINGNFRRLIATNTSGYDFPVGNATRSNLLQFLNNNITGTSSLTVAFGPKPGTDAGLNVFENGAYYSSVNNGGVWYLIPDVVPSGGSYALQLYFTGFTGLTDNLFGILRRPDASTSAADWKVPAGTALENYNGQGRKVSDGFARRINFSTFSQLGIGTLQSVPGNCTDCPAACTYTQGFYGNKIGLACYINNGVSSTINSTQLMLNAFGVLSNVVFGNVTNKRFFTLYKTDISNGNIFKMLPGNGNSLLLGVDNILPYDGAYYSDQSTWYLVPIPTSGSQKGKINNQLLSQLMTLWFNLRNTSTALGSISLSKDTLITRAQTTCGSGVPTGNPVKFGLPHNVVVYLNGGNGYNNTVNGLFQLANDVLGGANTAISPLDAQFAIAAINNAFDGCRILTGTIAYSGSTLRLITSTMSDGKPDLEISTKNFGVNAYPNPTSSSFRIEVQTNNEKEKIILQVYDGAGRLLELKNNLQIGAAFFIGEHYMPGAYYVRVVQGKEHKEIKLIKLSY